MEDYSRLINDIQAKVEIAQKKHEPVQHYIAQQISLLKQAQQEFVKEASKQGLTIKNNLQVAEVVLRQTFAMRELAEKAGLPIEEYVKKIEQIRRESLGNDVYQEHKNEF